MHPSPGCLPAPERFDRQANDVHTSSPDPIMSMSQFRVMAKQRHGDIAKIELLPVDDQRLGHAPGQYLNIVLPDGTVRAYSIANPPCADGRLELHVRRTPGGMVSDHLFSTLEVGDQLTVEGPHGGLQLSTESHLPALLVAGGTGFAPLKAIAEAMLESTPERKVMLYWGARTLADLYDMTLITSWASLHAGFRFIPVISEERDERARYGLVHEALRSDLPDIPDLSRHELYIAGPPGMVETVVAVALSAGLSPLRLFYDRSLSPSMERTNPTSAISASLIA